MFKSSFPLTFIVFIPAVLILVSPLPAEASHEFTVYRMQQYDLQGQPYGKVAASLACLSQKKQTSLREVGETGLSVRHQLALLSYTVSAQFPEAEFQ